MCFSEDVVSGADLIADGMQPETDWRRLAGVVGFGIGAAGIQYKGDFIGAKQETAQGNSFVEIHILTRCPSYI